MRYLAALFLAVTMLGCSEARKLEKKRTKAEALVKEAIETYPDILRVKVQTDTIVMWTEPKAGAGLRMYSQASMDSLAILCARILTRQRQEAIPDAVHLTRYVCRFDTVRLDSAGLQLLIWTDGKGVKYWYHVPAQMLDTVVTSSQRIITTEPCPPVTGERHWTRTGFWVLLIIWAIATLVFVTSLLYNGTRHER